jgi:hypothetical protein
MPTGVAAAVAGAAGLASASTYPEAQMLRGAILFVLTATLVCAGSDWMVGRRARETR